MPQRVDRSLFADSALLYDDFKGFLQRAGGKRFTAIPIGKEIGFGSALDPISAQQFQQSLRKGSIPVLAPFAIADPNQHPRTVNVLHLQLQPFGKTEAAGVDYGQGHANGRVLNKGKNVLHFTGTEDHRKLIPLFRTDEIKDEPFPLDGSLEEKLDAGQVDGESASRNTFILYKVEKIGTEFFLGNVFRRTVVMFGKTSDGAKISGLRLCRVPMQL